MNCENISDPCLGNPCQNGGTCIADVTQYSCECEDGFSGPDCTLGTTFDPCRSRPCFNSGICVVGVTGTSFYCHCLAGFSGTLCRERLALDPCLSNPCQNEGSCEADGKEGFVCHCLEGFGGTTCEQVVEETVDPCSPNPCQNEGSCELKHGEEFVCHCPNGFAGKMCEIHTSISTACDHNPCKNSATCVPLAEGFSCTCPQGLTGKLCEEQELKIVDPCEPNPCLNNGVCTYVNGNFTCVCWDEFAGPRCEAPVESTESSQTMSTESSTLEPAAPSFTSPHQWDQSDPSSSRTTPSSAVSTEDKMELLTSDTDWTTDLQEATTVGRERAHPCQSTPCVNGGVCVMRGDSYKCACAKGYVGKLCEIDVDECSSSPCQHGGTCSDYVNDFACSCAEGFTGLCAREINLYTSDSRGCKSIISVSLLLEL